jgi:endo-1,4-beta-D-glucanase Y
MNRSLRILLGAVAVAASAASAKFPLYDELPGKYPSFNTWDTRLPAIWTGWKSRFVVNGLVQGNDPAGKKRSISEGQSYGLLMAVWMGDQAMFNTILNATETTFWTGKWYRWTPGDDNFAGDADFDICGALIFASTLADKGKWDPNPQYKSKAITVLKSLIANFIDKGSNYRVNSWPGAGDGIRNAAYHMPQWYPIMKEFGDANGVTGMDWDAAAKGAFDFIEAQPNSSKGMARNFSTGTGGMPGGGTSSPNPYDMGFDAIRVPYRVGIAGIWYPNKFPRAIKYAKSVWAAGAVDKDKPGMYSVDNATLWGWTDHQYEEYMTRAMWGTLATAVKDSSTKGAEAYSAIRTFMSGNHVKPGLGYLAGAQTDSTCETCPAKNYFGQSLGLMGALALSGRAWNVWDDLMNKWTPPDTTPKITSALKAAPASIQLVGAGASAGTANTTTVTVSFSRPVVCTLYFVGRTSGAKRQYAVSPATNEVSYNWYNTKITAFGGASFSVAEVVDIRVSASGLNAADAGAKTTVTLTPSQTSIQPRKALLAPFAKGGVILTDRLWNAGDRVQTRLLDLNGRELRANGTTTLQATEKGLMAPLVLPRSLNLRLLEVSDLQNATTARYLISPNP